MAAPKEPTVISTLNQGVHALPNKGGLDSPNASPNAPVEKTSFFKNPLQYIKEAISPNKPSIEPDADRPISMEERKAQLGLAQRQQKGDGLAKAVESSLQHIENSKEEALERSWDFLTYITEKVSMLPPELQDRIVEIGKILSKAGTSYNHMIPNPHRRKESPAKIAALSAGGGGSKYDSAHG